MVSRGTVKSKKGWRKKKKWRPCMDAGATGSLPFPVGANCMAHLSAEGPPRAFDPRGGALPPVAGRVNPEGGREMQADRRLFTVKYYGRGRFFAEAVQNLATHHGPGSLIFP